MAIPHGKEIRTAWKEGKKEIELDGVLFKLSLQVINANFVASGIHQQQEERWIVAKPKDGSFVPVISVEEIEGKNTRSKF